MTPYEDTILEQQVEESPVLAVGELTTESDQELSDGKGAE